MEIWGSQFEDGSLRITIWGRKFEDDYRKIEILSKNWINYHKKAIKTNTQNEYVLDPTQGLNINPQDKTYICNDRAIRESLWWSFSFGHLLAIQYRLAEMLLIIEIINLLQSSITRFLAGRTYNEWLSNGLLFEIISFFIFFDFFLNNYDKISILP